MKGAKKSMDQLISEKPSQLILGIIFVIYILLNVQTPLFLATAIDNLFGKVVVVAIAALIFVKTNPVVGVLGFVVAYQLIKTASVTSGTYAMKHFLPSEANKMSEMQSFNEESVVPMATESTSAVQTASANGNTMTNTAGSLEAEMVSKMAPLVMSGPDSKLDYKPILDGQHSAASLIEEDM
jgi:hypothetical protein